MGSRVNYKDKITKQLEMNPSTASNQLIKNILYSLIQETNKNICFKCNKKFSREELSIEHKIPWVDSENPKELFFNLDNISFSHLKCNIASARRTTKINCPEGESWCTSCKKFQPLENFYKCKNKNSRNGVKYECKRCCIEKGIKRKIQSRLKAGQ